MAFQRKPHKRAKDLVPGEHFLLDATTTEDMVAYHVDPTHENSYYYDAQYPSETGVLDGMRWVWPLPEWTKRP